MTTDTAALRTANYASAQLPEHPLAMRRGELLLAALAVAGAGAASASLVLDFSGAAGGGVSAVPTFRSVSPPAGRLADEPQNAGSAGFSAPVLTANRTARPAGRSSPRAKATPAPGRSRRATGASASTARRAAAAAAAAAATSDAM
jgi:hypothetical protein